MFFYDMRLVLIAVIDLLMTGLKTTGKKNNSYQTVLHPVPEKTIPARRQACLTCLPAGRR
jgi:hypothetical protein